MVGPERRAGRRHPPRDRGVEGLALLRPRRQSENQAGDPLVGQALAALSGVDVPQVAARVATTIDDTIWREIGAEESAIRENPRATNDPLIMGVFGVGAAL